MLGKRLLLTGVGLTILIWTACGGGSSAFKAGRKAEAHKDWDTALVNYQRALQEEPENPSYIIHEKDVRMRAADFHLRQGRRLLANKRVEEAAGEFQKAVSIDPTNEAAAQELSRLLAQQAAAKEARQEALQEALQAREAQAAAGGPVKLKELSQAPMPLFRVAGDSRQAYQTLAKLAGINVAFTSDFQPRPVSMELTDVKFEDALRILSYQTKTFWRPLTSNTILVVPDNPTNRRDYDEEVLKTIYISNPLAPADRTAITTALKQVLGLQRIVDNPDANAIIIRAPPAQVAAAEKMIHDLDRGKAEILVDVTVIEADRNRVRELGLTPATINPASGTITPGLQGGLVFAPTTESGDGTTSSAGIRGGEFHDMLSNYALVLPGATASALMSDAHTRILQNPQVRVTDGQKATLKIGTRIPYATGSFLPSFTGTTGATGASFLASTQFQYQDVGVNLDITPRLMANGEVNLHAAIEISALGPSITIGGFSQPTFGQRKIEHDIRLKEGEVNLLGGLISSTVTRTVEGVPGLGNIPGLRYLFSSERNERVETEVMVMLTPRVIRLPDIASTGEEVAFPGGGGTAPTVFPGLPVPTPEVIPQQQPEGPPERPGQTQEQ